MLKELQSPATLNNVISNLKELIRLKCPDPESREQRLIRAVEWLTGPETRTPEINRLLLRFRRKNCTYEIFEFTLALMDRGFIRKEGEK